MSGYVCRIIIGVIAFLSRPANTNIQYHLGPDVEIGDSRESEGGKQTERREKEEQEEQESEDRDRGEGLHHH